MPYLVGEQGNLWGFFCRSLFWKGEPQARPQGWEGTCVAGDTHMSLSHVSSATWVWFNPQESQGMGKQLLDSQNPLREHLLLVVRPRILVSQPLRSMEGRADRTCPQNQQIPARELQGWMGSPS